MLLIIFFLKYIVLFYALSFMHSVIDMVTNICNDVNTHGSNLKIKNESHDTE